MPTFKDGMRFVGALAAGDAAEALDALDREFNQAAFERAASSAISELEAFKRKHAGPLEADAARSLGVLRSKVSDNARKTASLYAAAETAAQSVKKLSPPVSAPAETGPPGSGEADRSTVIAPFVATTSQRSAGPDRGTVERVLSHLSGLA